MLIWHLLTSLQKKNWCEAWDKLIWGSTYIGCILGVKCHQCGNAYLTFAYIIACIKKNWCEAWGELTWGSTYIGCILEVKCHQCGNAYLTFAYITACIFKALRIIDVWRFIHNLFICASCAHLQDVWPFCPAWFWSIS